MTNKTYQQETSGNSMPEYVAKQVIKLPELQITEFKQGFCFLCKNKTEDLTAFVHLACAISYEDKKKDNLKIWQSQQKGVKAL